MKAVNKPCPDCPFSRRVKPGALGGSKPEAYIGQILGPFVLPCHKHCDFDDPNWRQSAGDVPQCAGAAMMRYALATSMDLRYPGSIPLLAPTEDALVSLPEFYAHHTGVSVQQATSYLTFNKLRELLSEQLARAALGAKP